MTLLIACLLIHIGGLSGWFYVLAVYIWLMKKLVNNLDAIFVC